MVQISEPEDEPVTRGMPYNFIVLNSPVTGHLGKMIISPNWWNPFLWNLWFWKRDMRGYLSANFQTHRCSNFIDIIETVTGISAEEIKTLGLPVPGVFLHCFQKRSTLDSSIWRDISFYTIRSERFQVFKIMFSLTNPRSVSSETRTNTSNRYDLIFCYFHLRFSFQSDLSHQLYDKIVEVDNFQSWKYLISLKKMNWTPT